MTDDKELDFEIEEASQHELAKRIQWFSVVERAIEECLGVEAAFISDETQIKDFLYRDDKTNNLCLQRLKQKLGIDIDREDLCIHIMDKLALMTSAQRAN